MLYNTINKYNIQVNCTARTDESLSLPTSDDIRLVTESHTST
jgi:hypothetical protein